MSGSDIDEGRVDNARLTRSRSLRVPHVFQTLQPGDERRLRAENRARALAIARAAANAAAREQAVAARAAAMANGAASAASSSGTQLGMPSGPAGTFGSVGSSQSTSQMAGSQLSPLTPRGRELLELQQVERIRERLERELKQATDREKEIKNRTARLDTLEADKAALEGLDESAMSDQMKVLKNSVLSLHAHVDNRLDFMQNSLDQIVDLLQRPGFRPAAQSPLPLTAMSGPFPVQAGTQPSVLAQQDGKKLRPFEYMSKKMPSKKLAKSTYERELYALYKALVHWRHFLLGRFFYLRTDHQTLKWIKTQPALSDALKRWIEVIDQYDFKLEYLKGEYKKVADALFRRGDYLGALVFEFGVSEELTQSLVGAYQEDSVTMDIMRKLQAKDKATKDEFVMVDGLLFLDKAEFKRLVVPFSERLRSLFLGECHDATGHFGYKKTSANLVQRFWWSGMSEDAKKYVETCHVCQRDKLRTQAPLGLLKPLPIPAGLRQSVSMVFMDTLVTSRSGKRHIFVIIDRFTKYARLIAMPETERTEHVIKLFLDN
ncbi:hypothetical protein CBR_g26173 [Chara braunii]|uniref:Integrase zinc-binding domain-containing protein n=1 Tax=Chara braunii TaxID=69332 RepID=A0A388L763_CHABU|nr:hypothetical protein CBR_g26173 [Chara braunii]|eukprot:GBG78137.1 hypothetical protein CBR_g26173 [Chara braunii]